MFFGTFIVMSSSHHADGPLRQYEGEQNFCPLTQRILGENDTVVVPLQTIFAGGMRSHQVAGVFAGWLVCVQMLVEQTKSTVFDGLQRHLVHKITIKCVCSCS